MRGSRESRALRSPSCVICKRRKVKCDGQPAPCNNCRRLQLDCVFPASGPDALGHLPRPWMAAATETRTEAGTLRRRVVAACEECRARKAKCTGQRPECHRCSVRSLPCVYKNAGHRRTSQTTARGVSKSPASPAASASNDSRTRGDCIDTDSERLFLAKDIVARHIEAYFEYVYHLPGYDFFHRPSLLEDLDNKRIPAVLALAISAAASMYIATSQEQRQLAVQWAKDLDNYIFSNFGTLRLFNLPLMILSTFYHYSYRQFGQVWLMHGLATRLALSHQLNKPKPLNPDGLSIVSRECARRLIWALFIHDKIHSGGIEEFVALPGNWMLVSLPTKETNFQNEVENPTGTISDCTDCTTDLHGRLSIGGYVAILHNLRYEIISATKAFLCRKSGTAEVLPETLKMLSGLEEQLESFYRNLPPYLRLSDRNIFLHSTSPGLTAYISLHTWYLQTSCDLFRICLPGLSRESASPDLMQALPSDFVMRWRRRAVSFAMAMANTWARLLELNRSGMINPPGHLLHLSPESCVSIHQCTKILLIARHYRIYLGLVDPISKRPLALTDQIVEQLCQSSITFLGGLAARAPIASVVQQDVQRMLAAATINVASWMMPATSRIQQERILSRYHPLAVSISAAEESENLGRCPSAVPAAASPERDSAGVRAQQRESATVTDSQLAPARHLPQLTPLILGENRDPGTERDATPWRPVENFFTEYDVGSELDHFFFF